MKHVSRIIRLLASIGLILGLPWLMFAFGYSKFVGTSIGLGFLGEQAFYVCAGILYLLIHVLIWTIPHKKALVITGALGLGVVALLGANYLYGNAQTGMPVDYDADTAYEMIPDYGIDLEAYLPFTSTQIARLEESSTLSFSADDDLPRMDAAVALLPMMSSFATACYPEETTTVEWDWTHNNYEYELNEYGFAETMTLQFNNSDMGFDALATNATDVFFGLEAADYQLEYARNRNVEFEYTPICLEAFVFLVNERNSVDSLTFEQIQKIYSGEIRNWSEVGGTPGSIIAYQRNQGSGSQTTMERFMGEYTLADAPIEIYISSMGGLIKNVADYDNGPHAIGYSFRYYASELVGSYPVKLLSIDGVAPTTQNIAQGSYPLTENFYAVTRKGELEKGRAELAENPKANSREANLARLIDWICSGQGQYLVEQSSYTPAYS